MTATDMSLKHWILLCASGVLVFLMNIDYTAVNLTLVPISIELNADLNTLQWLLSGYVLVWAALVIPAGRIADIYGKRDTLLFGLLLFMAGSLMTGMGHDVTILIGGRLIQGMGAALLTAPFWALIFSSAPPSKQGMAMGFVMGFAGAGMAAGPTLGGYLIAEFDWRWIYYVNIPIGLFVSGVFMASIPQEKRQKIKETLDGLGVLLLAGALASFVFALNQIEIWGCDLRFWGLITFSALLLFGFIRRDKSQTRRMVPPLLLQSKAFMACCMACFMIAMIFSGVLVLMGLYLQNAKGLSTYETGIIFFSMTISMGILSPFGGKLVDRLGVRNPMLMGSTLSGMATFLMAFFDSASGLPLICVSLFLAGTGIGIYYTAGNIAMMRAVPQDSLNLASGIYTMAMMLGNTLSIVLSTSFLVLFGRDHLLSHLSGVSMEPTQTAQLIQAIAKAHPTAADLGAFSSDKIDALLTYLQQAFVNSFGINMGLLTGLSVVAFLIIRRGVKGLDAANQTPTTHGGVL